MLYNQKWDVAIDSDVVSVLRAAKQIISDPSRWTCGEYARTSRGKCIGVECDAAVSFCSIGALASALGSDVDAAENSAAYKLLHRVATEESYWSVASLNDQGGHAAAMSMFDRAIEIASA